MLIKLIKNVSIYFVLLILGLNSCIYSVHYDSFSEFLITGQVYDGRNNKPIVNVKILFIDRGFDSVRSKSYSSYEAGNSDKYGRINFVFEYFWGFTKGFFNKEPSKEFDILISKEFYKLKKYNFKATELSSEISEQGSIRYNVNLQEIYLEPTK